MGKAAGDDVHARLDDGPPDEVDRGPGAIAKGSGAEEDGRSDDGCDDATAGNKILAMLTVM